MNPSSNVEPMLISEKGRSFKSVNSFKQTEREIIHMNDKDIVTQTTIVSEIRKESQQIVNFSLGMQSKVKMV
jgi:hypothetical protein